jgi:hypothetical protein
MPRYDLKAYTSLTARLPQDLADQVKRYALEHRCGLSELIRDGLEMRLEADTPWHAAARTRTPDAEVLQEVLHLLETVIPTLRTQLLATVRETLPEVLQEVLHRETSRIAAPREVLQEVLPHGAEAVSIPPAGGKTEVIPQQPAPARRRPGKTEVLPPDADAPASPVEGLTEVGPFDATKYHLGKLCPRGHDYQGTGQTLRSNNVAGYCLQCNVEGTRARRAARRQREGRT